MSQPDLHREVIKLLVQVAWADGTIAAGEREHILAMAKGANFADHELTDLSASMLDRNKMMAPDYAYLKRFKQQVRRAAMVLSRMDGHMALDEARMMERIENLLDED